MRQRDPLDAEIYHGCAMTPPGEFCKYHGSMHSDPRPQGGRCPDCGEPGERAGHMGCQYPENHE